MSTRRADTGVMRVLQSTMCGNPHNRFASRCHAPFRKQHRTWTTAMRSLPSRRRRGRPCNQSPLIRRRCLCYSHVTWPASRVTLYQERPWQAVALRIVFSDQSGSITASTWVGYFLRGLTLHSKCCIRRARRRSDFRIPRFRKERVCLTSCDQNWKLTRHELEEVFAFVDCGWMKAWVKMRVPRLRSGRTLDAPGSSWMYA